jgi:hypothetical protein
MEFVMRRVLPLTVLLATLLVGACSDSGPTAGSQLRASSAFSASRATVVDQLILQLFPRGLETATGKRWDHIDSELGAWNASTNSWSGNVESARKHLLDLTKLVDLKTDDIEAGNLSGETKEHAKDRLMYAMNAYFFGGPDATDVLPGAATDFAVQIVPAGQAALVQAPSLQAGVRFEEGTTNEDRVIAVFQSPNQQTARCDGPLNTDRCQYPLFYRFESFPHLKLAKSARFAVCPIFDGNGPTHVEHDYIQLAHTLPAEAANYTTHTPGAIQEGQIELLPRATTSTGVTACDEPPHEEIAGILGAGKRLLYAAAQFAGKLIAPRAAYAYDQGPEHLGDFFSDFVGVGAPDYEGVWNGTTKPEGAPESSAQPITVTITGQTDAGVTGQYLVAVLGDDAAYNIAPATEGDVGGWGRFISASSVRFNGLDFTIDPFFSPSSGAIKLERILTYSVVDGIPRLSGLGIRTLPGDVTDRWTVSLTRATSPIVCLPPGCNIVISLRAATGATASTTAGPVPIE